MICLNLMQFKWKWNLQIYVRKLFKSPARLEQSRDSGPDVENKQEKCGKLSPPSPCLACSVQHCPGADSVSKIRSDLPTNIVIMLTEFLPINKIGNICLSYSFLEKCFLKCFIKYLKNVELAGCFIIVHETINYEELVSLLARYPPQWGVLSETLVWFVVWSNQQEGGGWMVWLCVVGPGV